MTRADLLNNQDPNLLQQEWWVQRWLELLDSYRFKKRLERARIYAREGNVLSIEFEGGQVLAKVQGSEVEPYQVSLSLDPFTDEDWNYVMQTLSEKAVFSAQLLAGEMPNNIERVFTQNGLSIFPFQLSDVRSYCSCPDKANPCKHIGAIYYQLADRFSEDPFVIFQLRGRSKAQILEGLRELRCRQIEENGSKIEENQQKEAKKSNKKTKISEPSNELDLTAFWQYDQPLDPSLVVIVPPSDGQTVLDVLGRIPLAHEEAKIVKDHLQQVYQTVSQQAMIAALNVNSDH
ncbi:SWIM zinc finger family protein [Crocosphaera sp. XPORK-15E]|uniref:SWIM zinc finger family protein n=1 Tax=Crocosphaera sp. XPORK-15E TaxID=3110247 RepID=UPI002B213DAD|nr:SWIM zinc finger family protein [Crocosphaera sp. XPORK-15E]MEA5533434.1 SWIM zinc finger family protein [Crocosphaera sp. XPORK-15E]